jgi:post-segregation antitoxin (ccd killing protein)
MGDKGKITLYMDLEVVEKAKEIGLNISKVSENALIEAIKRLEGSDCSENRENMQSDCQNDRWCGRRDLNPGRQRGRLMS